MIILKVVMIRYFYFICLFLLLCATAHANLTAASFPETPDDISFAARVEFAMENYKPFLDKKAYQELGIVSGEEYFTDHLILSELEEEEQQAQDAQSMSREEYCENYPEDALLCPNNAATNIFATSYTPNANCVTDWTIGRQPVTPNKYVTGGACYPPEHAGKGRENRILTSGRYEFISPAFEKGMTVILRKEGSCGIKKGDPGGFTCLGIAWNFNKDKFSSIEELKNITYAQAEDYYYKYFWIKYKIYLLPDVISCYYLWAAMGSGPYWAYTNFRKFLGVKSYNKALQVTPDMVEAVKNYNGDITKDWMDKVRGPFLLHCKNVYETQRDPGKKMGGFAWSITFQKENGCHVCPKNPLHRPAQPIQRVIK